MDDDEDMADLYLSRKLVSALSPISDSGASSPTTKSKSVATYLRDENDVDEIEMLLEVIIPFIFSIKEIIFHFKLLWKAILISDVIHFLGLFHANWWNFR